MFKFFPVSIKILCNTIVFFIQIHDVTIFILNQQIISSLGLLSESSSIRDTVSIDIALVVPVTCVIPLLNNQDQVSF